MFVVILLSVRCLTPLTHLIFLTIFPSPTSHMRKLRFQQLSVPQSMAIRPSASPRSLLEMQNLRLHQPTDAEFTGDLYAHQILRITSDFPKVKAHKQWKLIPKPVVLALQLQHSQVKSEIKLLALAEQKRSSLKIRHQFSHLLKS